MKYSFGDLYPSFATMTTDMTSLMANPDKEDQEALNESANVADKIDTKSSRSFTVIIALVFIVLAVVFLGVS